MGTPAEDKGEIEVTALVETTSSALSEITRGEVDMQVATAKRYPRDLVKFKRDAESMATIDTETAEACFYVLQREGKNIEGPGVRLAEIIASCWGNLRCEARVVDEDSHFLTAQGTCWDMERNVLVRMEVRRRITNRQGKLYSDDMRVVTGNAAAAIAFRNAVFKVIPNAFTKQIYEKARRVAVGDERTLGDRRDRALTWFNKAGVPTERLLVMLGKTGIEAVDLNDLATLQGMRTALGEGSTTLDQLFPPIAAAPPPAGVHTFAGKTTPQAVPNQPAAEPAAKVEAELEQKRDEQAAAPPKEEPKPAAAPPAADSSGQQTLGNGKKRGW